MKVLLSLNVAPDLFTYNLQKKSGACPGRAQWRAKEVWCVSRRGAVLNDYGEANTVSIEPDTSNQIQSLGKVP
jgi:hypothetical protein